jgi:GxxExxY protein
MVSSTKRVFQPIPPDVERIGKVVLDAAYAVHTELGPGLLESVYRIAMKHVIEGNGVLTETEESFQYCFAVYCWSQAYVSTCLSIRM